MKTWLLTPEYGQPFIVRADTAEQAVEMSDSDILYIHEHDLFSVLREDPADNGFDYMEYSE